MLADALLADAMLGTRWGARLLDDLTLGAPAELRVCQSVLLLR